MKVVLIALIALCIVSCKTERKSQKTSSKVEAQLCGGYTNQHSMTQSEVDLFYQVWNKYSSTEMVPTSVATQVVAGTNYHYVCYPKGNKRTTVDVVIYEPLPGQGEPSVTSVEGMNVSLKK